MRADLMAVRSAFSQGRLEWIGLRAAHRQAMTVVAKVEAVAGQGLIGDRAGARPGSKRQVTLIQAEHLPVIAALAGLPLVQPEWLRRNLVISGINLVALENKRFRVGEVLLAGTGFCQPCARMEEALGVGGYNAMRGHGGITAQVLETGVLRIGHAVRLAGAGL
jgi:MOSC domain-containing protein YiiM